MKKQALLRGILGIPLGISIGHIITIIISLVFSKGYYLSCVPAFIDIMGNEINAVILQTFLNALLGATFAASSVIWEMDDWSIAGQTGIYFLITSTVMMPVAYFTHWMEHSFSGFVIYLAFFAAIFTVIWLMQYLIWKIKIKKMNSKLK